MIHSMTAFAREEATGEWGSAIWEVRSVNFRYLDVNIRLPEDLRMLETAVREHTAARVTRGKIDCTLRYQTATTQGAEFAVNMALAERLVEAGRQIDALLDEPGRTNAMEVLRWPGVMELRPPDLDGVSQAVLELLDDALDSLVSMRRREGEKIFELIGGRCEEVDRITKEVGKDLPRIQAAMRERIAGRLAEVKEQLDNERVEQEMVLFANKMDVAEELDRLGAHSEEVRHVLQASKPTGRRLDFLMQEMNREANTLGSKSVDTIMSRASVELKVLIEQMREQIQNIE